MGKVRTENLAHKPFLENKISQYGPVFSSIRKWVLLLGLLLVINEDSFYAYNHGEDLGGAILHES